MELGLVGLGKMGGNMRERIRRAGHTVLGYDRNPDVSDVHSLEELVGKLKGPRVIWVMVPAGAATQSTIDELAALLSPGDIVVDGGNSRWTDDEKHAVELGIKGIGFVDCGVSGGVWGLENGYALMYGGDADHVARVQPIFVCARSSAPGRRARSSVPGCSTWRSTRWTTTSTSRITASLFARFASRQDDSPQMKMIAALRNQFGGHAVENKK